MSTDKYHACGQHQKQTARKFTQSFFGFVITLHLPMHLDSHSFEHRTMSRTSSVHTCQPNDRLQRARKVHYPRNAPTLSSKQMHRAMETIAQNDRNTLNRYAVGHSQRKSKRSIQTKSLNIFSSTCYFFKSFSIFVDCKSPEITKNVSTITGGNTIAPRQVSPY